MEVQDANAAEVAEPGAPRLAAITGHLADILVEVAQPDSVDPEMPISVSFTRDRLDRHRQTWSNRDTAWGRFRDEMLDDGHWPFIGIKEEAPAFCAATFVGPQRLAKDAKAVSLLVSDHDDGLTMRESAEAARRHGDEAIILPSFNFGATDIGIERDKYIEWARTHGKPTAITEALGREYLEATGKLLPDFARSATYDGRPPTQVAGSGFVYLFITTPREKHRVIRPLLVPFVVAHYMQGDTTHKQIIAAYALAYKAALERTGTSFDTACSDLARPYYFPAQRSSGKELPRPIHVAGRPTDLQPFVEVALDQVRAPSPKSGAKATAGAHATSDGLTHEGLDLKHWVAQGGGKFELETALTSRPGFEDIDRGPRSAKPGRHIACPFEDQHTKTGGAGFFVVNASDNDGNFAVHCCHDSCQAEHGNGRKGVDRLIYIRQWLRDGLLTLDDLRDPQLYDGGQVPQMLCKPTRELVLQMIAALPDAPKADDWAAIWDALARCNDKDFDEEVYDALQDKTRKRNRTQWRKQVAEIRKKNTQARCKEAEASAQESVNPGVKRFHNWNDGIPHRVTTDSVVAHLVARNASVPQLFRRGRGYVKIVENHTTQLREAQQLSADLMATEINSCTDWSQTVAREHGDPPFVTKYSPCPKRVAEDVVNRSGVDFPLLKGFADAPFYDQAANLVTQPGYHAPSGIFYQPREGLLVPPVPTTPTTVDVARAKSLLIDEVYEGFPFNDGCVEDKHVGGKASLANQLAKTLQPFCREMFDGPSPIYGVDKPAYGIGASLLSQAFSLIAYGIEPSTETEKGNDDEWRKALQTHAMAGTRHILIDNAKQKIESTDLAAGATATILQGRVLGKSEIGGGPVAWVFEINGVGLKFSEEIARRTVMTRLDTETARPTEGRNFKHQGEDALRAWIRENRGELVWACLVLIQNWIAQGRPPYSGKILASFGGWCRVLGGVLEAAGIEGLNENRHLLETDDDAKGFLVFAGRWLEKFGTGEVLVGELEPYAERKPDRSEYARLVELFHDLGPDVVDMGLRRDPRTDTLGVRLGRKLAPLHGRVFTIAGKDYKVVRRETAAGTKYQLWPMPDRADAWSIQ